VIGRSENIHVASVIGDFWSIRASSSSANGRKIPSTGEFYIGSADWMYRNLLERVEAVVPSKIDAFAKNFGKFSGHAKRQSPGVDMHSDGTYTQRRAAECAGEQGTHQTLMSLTRQRGAAHTTVHGM